MEKNLRRASLSECSLVDWIRLSCSSEIFEATMKFDYGSRCSSRNQFLNNLKAFGQETLKQEYVHLIVHFGVDRGSSAA